MGTEKVRNWLCLMSASRLLCSKFLAPTPRFFIFLVYMFDVVDEFRVRELRFWRFQSLRLRSLFICGQYLPCANKSLIWTKQVRRSKLECTSIVVNIWLELSEVWNVFPWPAGQCLCLVSCPREGRPDQIFRQTNDPPSPVGVHWTKFWPDSSNYCI